MSHQRVPFDQLQEDLRETLINRVEATVASEMVNAKGDAEFAHIYMGLAAIPREAWHVAADRFRAKGYIVSVEDPIFKISRKKR